MQFKHSVILSIFILCISQISFAEDEYKIQTDPSTNIRYFLFKTSKGEVRFNHDLHQAVMKLESCLPCHKTKTPTKDHTMTKFSQRSAHAFCKGCHKDKNQGPTECHECHKENNLVK